MLPADQIAASVRASRSEFEQIYRQAQVAAFGFARPLVEFAAVGLSSNDTEAFEQAIVAADSGGWLQALVDVLVDRGMENGTLARELFRHSAALQAIVSDEQGFLQPEIMSRGVARGMSWTVKVLVALDHGTAKGSGILIGPHLVLTAWHVVRPLFTPRADGTWAALKDGSSRIQIEFDDFLRVAGSGLLPQATKRVKAHQDWCVAFSPCTPDELEFKLPEPLTTLEKFCDYAIIRLEKATGAERRWAVIESAPVPDPDDHVIVFEHPDGQPLRVALGSIVKPEAHASVAIPGFRFLHGCNTLPGASGGPCFDKSFSLFGLHQGEWKPKVNRGVPLARVREHYKTFMGELPAPDPSQLTIWRLADQPWPVIGCDDFQTLAWRASALNGATRVIVIAGEPASGKSFQLDVLSAVLPPSGHLQIELQAPAISKLEASALAVEICRQAGAEVPQFVSAEEFNTTLSTWLRDELAAKTIAALNQVRGDRMVWLRLEDLNKTEIQGKDASAMLVAIYEKTAATPWLRVVLDGMKGDVPFAVEAISSRYRLAQPTRKGIAAYLTRAIVSVQDGAAGPPDGPTINTLAVGAMQDYDTWREEDPATAMRKLAVKSMRLVKNYFEAREGGE